MEHGQIVENLFKQYKTRYELEKPDWAYPLPPTIPFVGRSYLQSNPRIAIYASAENLSHYERDPESIPDFLKDERVWNRHRAACESSWDGYFPYVHIAPVENGGLLCAALFLRQEHLKHDAPAAPRDFLEDLVVANTAKYSIRVGKSANQDYASDRVRLRSSLPYLSIDLELLRPDILMIPKSMYKQKQVRNVVREATPSTRVLPVPQLNPTVINIHLAKHSGRAKELEAELVGTPLEEWTKRVSGLRDGYLYRYYAELEMLLRKQEEVGNGN